MTQHSTWGLDARPSSQVGPLLDNLVYMEYANDSSTSCTLFASKASKLSIAEQVDLESTSISISFSRWGVCGWCGSGWYGGVLEWCGGVVVGLWSGGAALVGDSVGALVGVLVGVLLGVVYGVLCVIVVDVSVLASVG